MKHVAILFMLVALTACAFRGDLVRAPETTVETDLRKVYFATNRGFSGFPFGSNRREEMSFGEAVVSIPPAHKPGEIEWPRGKPDPAKHFLLQSTAAYDDISSFVRAINAELATKPSGEREITLFVHGFNTRFGDGIYRMAQIGHDLDVPGVAVQFAWPSAGHPLGYIYDRDSALFARDDLEQLITALSHTNAEAILVVAHSLGSFLTMEALRQIRLRGRSFARLAGVVLMSPDIDLKVFRTQLDSVKPLPRPFVVFTSQKDRALGLSERITGQNERVGRLADVSKLSDYDITFIDVSAFEDGGLNHFTIARSPALLKLLGQVTDFETAFSNDQSSRAGLLPGTVLSVQNATRIIVSPIAGGTTAP